MSLTSLLNTMGIDLIYQYDRNRFNFQLLLTPFSFPQNCFTSYYYPFTPKKDLNRLIFKQYMSKPFNRGRKLDQKLKLQPADQNRKESAERNSGSRERPKPVLNLGGRRKLNIANSDAPKNSQDKQPQPQQKTSLGSKPNLFKGKRQGNKLLLPNRDSNNVETGDQNFGEAPKPTPQVPRKKGKFDFRGRKQENVLIQDEESSMNFRPEESRDLNAEDSTNLLSKPPMKIKKLTPRREISERRGIEQQSGDFSRSGENQSYVPANQPMPFNIQYREINIQAKAEISEGKIDKQKKRTHELSPLLNLQMDLYEQTLSIGNITSYEIYINKIKGGFLKNSSDQAFDEKSSNSCQTLSFEYADFTNQCPQDYAVDVNKIQKMDAEHLFDQFILKISPVIEELIQPTDTITDPPIFLLAFRPEFKAFMKCPYPIFIYRSSEFGLDLIVVGQKLYIAEGEIESVLMIGKSIIAGLKNGYLILWNGDNNKSSRLYHQIKEYTNTTNFQLPSFCSHHLEKYSPYVSDFSVVALWHETGPQFTSLDACGKLVRWAVQDQQTGSQVLRPASVVQLRNMLQRPSLTAFKVKKKADCYYVSTSMGLILLQNGQIRQKLQTFNQRILQYEMPKKYNFVFTISSTTLKIYNELYSHPLLSMHFQLNGQHLTQIILPDLEHENRQFDILSAIYVTDSAGHIFEVKLLENQYQYVKKLNEEEFEGRKDKNVIFRGVNRVGDCFETLRLMRDLKMSKMAVKMGVNTEKSVSNLKAILAQNQELKNMLEEQSAMMV